MSKERLALYDEQCTLCQQTKKTVQRWDWLHRIEWVSLQEYEKSEKPIQFQAIDLRRELHLLVKNQDKVKVLRGFQAVRHLLIQLPVTFVIGSVCYIPGVSLIGNPLYKWVAKRRYQLMKGKCDSEHCSI